MDNCLLVLSWRERGGGRGEEWEGDGRGGGMGDKILSYQRDSLSGSRGPWSARLLMARDDAFCTSMSGSVSKWISGSSCVSVIGSVTEGEGRWAGGGEGRGENVRI